MAIFHGTADGDIISAGAGNDTVFAGAGDDYVFGQAGNDRIDSGPGSDVLDGGAGDDDLIGGGGQDILYGGFDADVFVYVFRTEASPSGGAGAFGTDGNDIVFDSSAADRDVMRLDAATDLTAARASGIDSDPGEILITQTAENAVLTFVGNGATIQFDNLGVSQIGAIGGDTLQALEAKLIGIAGDSS